MLEADPLIFSIDLNNVFRVTANDPNKVGIYIVLVKGILKMTQTEELRNK